MLLLLHVHALYLRFLTHEPYKDHAYITQQLQKTVQDRDFSRNFSKRGGGRSIEKHALDHTKYDAFHCCDLQWKLVYMFTLIWMWSAAMHIIMYVQHINFERGGEDSHEGGEDSPPPPWPYVEKTMQG